MQIFIWQYLGRVSDNYHCGGGAAIIARDADRARALIEATDHLEVEPAEWAEAVVYDGVPAADERVFIFPDAGCC